MGLDSLTSLDRPLSGRSRTLFFFYMQNVLAWHVCVLLFVWKVQNHPQQFPFRLFGPYMEKRKLNWFKGVLRLRFLKTISKVSTYCYAFTHGLSAKWKWHFPWENLSAFPGLSSKLPGFCSWWLVNRCIKNKNSPLARSLSTSNRFVTQAKIMSLRKDFPKLPSSLLR